MRDYAPESAFARASRGATPLDKSRPQRVAPLTWTDDSGPHELRIEKAISLGSSPRAPPIARLSPASARVHAN